MSLACLSRDGHQVIGVDIDRTKLDLIASGKTPVVEEGMVDLMAQVAASGRVTVTTDAQQAVRDSEISLVCVGTPSAPNGSQDQGAILRLAKANGMDAPCARRIENLVREAEAAGKDFPGITPEAVGGGSGVSATGSTRL